jgi:hypothetical protein
MTKKIIKTILVILLFFTLIIFYLSFFGINTKVFNDQIKIKLSAINTGIKFNINEVNYRLNPLNFTINIITENIQIISNNNKLDLESIKTNVSVKSLIYEEFSIDELKISTREIKLNDLLLFAKIIHDIPHLYILDTIIKDGTMVADISINFDKEGKIKDNFKMEGFIKETNLNFLNKFKVKDLNLAFDIVKNKFLLKKINAKFNGINFKSPQIQIKEKKDLYLVDGILKNKNHAFEGKDLRQMFGNLFNNFDIKRIEFGSSNNFSFSINKKYRFNDFNIETIIDLSELEFSEKRLDLKRFLVNSNKNIKFNNHKIKINYNKEKFTINGDGDVFFTNKVEKLSYEIDRGKSQFFFDIKLNVKNNPLLIEFLDYEKETGTDLLISIIGNQKKNGQTRFNSISLEENKNQIQINNLELNQNFKITDIDSIDVNFKNTKDLNNKISLKKKNSNFFLEGDLLDATKIINTIMDSDEQSITFFENLNSKIKIKIKKIYIDDVNYMNNLYGDISYINNKLDNLKLKSIFPNKKEINLSIKTNNNFEVETKLFSSYPKPLIKRYNFIRGFEEGYLEFYSSKKGNISNSTLIISDFKVKEVPILAKLLSLSSLQGIADLLTGEGIRFTDFEMNFSNQNSLTKIQEMYAIGPAVSVLMDGYIESKKLISLRGTLVPATTINKTIASIPLLGKILIGDKTGEGVFGVSFKIKGPPKNLKTSVNPIKTLTPRFITRTLEKIKKN